MKSIQNISNLFKKGVLLALISILASCDVQVLEISETEFFITKEWKIETYYVDEIPQTNNDLSTPSDKLENFRLKLNEDLTYSIINFDGSESSGEWTLTSGLTQLTLDGYILESWTIDLNIRNLDLKYLSPPNKPDWDIRYLLEPVRGQ